MPYYEYQCVESGEIFEILAPISDSDKKELPCHIHRIKPNGNGNNYLVDHLAEKIWSKPANIQLGEPTRYAVDKQGNIHLLHSKYDQPDKDCEVRELKGPVERSKFENSQMEMQKAKSRTEAYFREARDNEEIKIRHDDTKAKMGTFDGETQTLMKAAMERTKKIAAKPKVIKEPKFWISSNHMDNAK